MEILYPAYLYCFCCGSVIDKSRVYGLCDNCITRFRWATGRTCDKCGKPLSENSIRNLCDDCIERSRFFDRGFTCTGYGLYERKLISEFKKKGKSYMAQAIGRILHDRIVITNISFDVIIPIPIHGKKLKTRGYDQAVLMALELSKLTGVAADLNAVKRSKMTAPNKNLGAEQRAENMRGAFVVTESGKIRLRGKDILIVDDIYTTGATVDACAEVLKKAGVGKVYVLTLASGTYSFK